MVIAALERFNEFVACYEEKSPKEKKTSYNLLLEYLITSPECVEIFDFIADKEVYFKPEVRTCLQICYQ